jgi:hypothetical protein
MKKERERYWLDCARAIRPDLFRGEVEEGEAPDFVLRGPGACLGVELTRYSRPVLSGKAIAEEQSGLKDKVLRLAKAHFSGKSQSLLRVGVVFAPNALLRKQRLSVMAEQIAEYLLTHLDGKPDWTHVRWSLDDDETDSPPEEIATVYARVIPSIGNTHWYPADAGWVSNVGKDEVTRIVGKKEPNVPQYRLRCDTLSLLIVFEGRPELASSIHAPLEPADFQVRTAFDSVYCLEPTDRRLVVIPTKPPLA